MCVIALRARDWEKILDYSHEGIVNYDAREGIKTIFKNGERGTYYLKPKMPLFSLDETS